jgi:hypothetical protein
MQLKLVSDVKPVGRQMRNPQHSFSLRTRPWQIQPMMIAPVLPGETLKSLLVQARVVSKPVKSPLVGWWCEMYYFYVKHRDLPNAQQFIDMHLGQPPAFARQGATSADMYTAIGDLPIVQACLQKVVEDYFRDEGQAWDNFKIGNLPLAKVGHDSWLDSFRLDSDVAPVQDHELPGEVNVQPFGSDPAMATAYAQWENMTALRLTTKSFEDYLAEWGIKSPEVVEAMNRVELIRYVRKWEYPSNTISPTDGTPSAAMSWSLSERADKDRFFAEPGYLFGVTVCRPKVYMSNMKGNAAAMLDTAYHWLPPSVDDQVWTSLKKTLATNGPLAGALGASPAGDYWVDMRDLFLRGDQFVNYDLVTDGSGSHVVLPVAANQDYASAAMADALFKVGAANTISYDGVQSLSILGRVGKDTTG